MTDDKLKFFRPEDFEELLDLGNVIVIAPKTDIKISCVFSEVNDMAKGKVRMREETHLFFDEEECFLIPSGQFGKILSQIHATLVEKGVTDDKEEGTEPKPGEPSVH